MDLTTAQAHLDAWLAADLALASGQSYSVAGRTVTRADAQSVADNIARWQRVIRDLETAAAGATNSGVSFAKFR